MKIHEYQAKELLRAAGVPVLAGRVARTPDEAAAAFTALGTPICAVKAQIHAGGRGKGMVKGSTQRGVELAKSADDAARIAKGLLDQTLVTIQTGPEGKKVSTLSLCKENGWLGFVRFMTALVVVIQPFCILFASSSYASATGDEPEAAPGEDRRKSTTGSVSNAGAPAPSAPVPGLVDHATLSGVPSNFSGYQSMQ
jgi:hypothetical protein